MKAKCKMISDSAVAFSNRSVYAYRKEAANTFILLILMITNSVAKANMSNVASA